MREELILKFFEKKCIPEEAEQVADFLKKNPDVAEKFLSIKEWQEAETSSPLSSQVQLKIWQRLSALIKKEIIVVRIKYAAVAACTIGIIGLGLYLFEKTGKASENYVKQVSVKDEKAPFTSEKILANTTGKPLKQVLSDGSIVVVSPGSFIRYNESFESNKREIFLQGEAFFKVAKDKTRPFTVYAANLATTALGTQFKITAQNKTPGKIRVQLFEGKVVIKAITKLPGWDKDVYLSPGEQLNFDRDQMLLAVNNIKSIKVESPSKTNHENQLNNKNTSLNFSSDSLCTVFEKLSKFYNVKIDYDKNDIETKSFTGNISANDSLSIMLNVIAQMNDLEVSQENNNYIIRKKQE